MNSFTFKNELEREREKDDFSLKHFNEVLSKVRKTTRKNVLTRRLLN